MSAQETHQSLNPNPLMTPNRTPNNDSAYQGSSNHSRTPAFSPPDGRAGAKVAISRISTSRPAPQHHQRATRACELCRQRKIKCSADHPSCRQCLDLNHNCVYMKGKKAQEEKKLTLLTQKVEQYEKLLSDISKEVRGHLARRIGRILKGKNSSEDSRTPKEGGKSDPEDSSTSSSSLGSLNGIDIVEEDLNRNANTRATGFMGKNSEVTWMKRLEAEADIHDNISATNTQNFSKDQMRNIHRELPIHDRRGSLTNLNYHLDDLAITRTDDVDPYTLPPNHVADRLFNTYLEYVHPSFPVIRKETFTAQYQHFFAHPKSNPGSKWLSILNIIFAIGFRYCELLETSISDDPVYLQRARKLALGDDVLFSHADLQMVQVEALSALYLLASGQLNRAWSVSGLAIRSAIALGINLRNVDNKTTDESKEARSRLWWCLYYLEHLLAVSTGRVSCISQSATSTGLPVPFEEDSDPQAAMHMFHKPPYHECHIKGTLFEDSTEVATTTKWLKNIQPNQSLYFFMLVDLTLISHAVINTAYTVNALRDGWYETVAQISRLSSKLDVWVSKVPDAYRFLPGEQDHGFEKNDWTKERFSLAINFFSAQITLTRPCLTHLRSKETSPSSERKNSHIKLSNEMAQVCLDSALSLVGLLPEDPDVAWLFRLSPWWSILHHIMQATVIILIHLSIGIIEEALRVTTILSAAKKLHRWLFHMANRSLSYQRAFALCDGFIQRIALQKGFDISDLSSPASMERPEPSAKRHKWGKSPFPSQRPSQSQSDIPVSTEDLFHSDVTPDQQSLFHSGGIPLVDFLSSDLDVPQFSFSIPEQTPESIPTTDYAYMDTDPINPSQSSYSPPLDVPVSSLFSQELEEARQQEPLEKKGV
ncbi:fungal specific transcription factor [Paecilomyces variotii No. 5]|uniref:Fungal specific transcription factor n=1 Tax=Byssochlamys spectabilis (strain No. 5 / NBRC 109023) TaxID=1356009 RepID=V5HW84_BYSSN|nr:fungal specific transcription factor [Paecilomyces variotii No. 5]